MAHKSLFLPPIPPLPAALALAAIGLSVSITAPAVAPAYLALLLSALVAIGLLILHSLQDSESQPLIVRTLLDLSRDQEISTIHTELAEALCQVANQKDPIYRRLVLQRLQSTVDQCSSMGTGTIEFPSTESWRVVYEELLRSPGLHMYRSAAYIESPHYWQDGPGQQSTRLNLELHDARVVSIERIAIIADHLWAEDSLFPIEPIHSWLDEQHRHGIWIRLLRESALGADTDLLNDFGIYGYRAVGTQRLDPTGRTIRFMLSFDFDKLQQAESHWSRLAVYSISYRELLDQQH
ncbi:MAG: hypothetical protein IT422_06685 [Pirellulaceae bacterium]|nr:hypothetical protein [Pirellulaceae bacterium]